MSSRSASRERFGRSLLRRLSLAAFFLLLIAATLTARVVLEGQSELAASDAAFDRGELVPSLEHARRSATLYAPGAPHVRHAYERLIAIATGAEAAGEVKVALLAWQAVRSAALESRHAWLPEQGALERANQNLARLETLSRQVRDSDLGTAQARSLNRLNEDDAPAPAWLALLGLGFLLALAGLGLCAFRGLEPNGKLSLQRVRLGLLLLAVGTACWALAAYKA